MIFPQVDILEKSRLADVKYFVYSATDGFMPTHLRDDQPIRTQDEMSGDDFTLLYKN